MKRIRYEVQRGDTPGLIAERFTGDRNRWSDLIAANPKIPVRHDGMMGKSFEPSRFQAGMLIDIPNAWESYGQLDGRGFVGESCSPTPVEAHPTAYYQIQQDEWEAAVAVKFGQVKNGFGDWHPIVGANVGWWAKGFYSTDVGCKMNGWKAGQLIRIPKAWLDVPAPQFPKDALPFLKNVDGTAWVPSGGGGGGGGGCPPGLFINPNTSACEPAPTCAAGEIFDPTTWACKKASGDKVDAKEDESFFKRNLGWLAAAGVVLGIGGALAVNHFTKARKAEGQRLDEKKGRPALPAHKEEAR